MLVTLSKRDRTVTASMPTVSRRKVLIAEDSGDIREILQLLLETNGFEVITTSDGRNALQLAQQHVPDLILLDLQLPWLDGLTIAHKVRMDASLNNTLIVIVSGHDPGYYRREALAAGCYDYMQKPIDFDRLEKLLEFVRGNKAFRRAAG